MKPAIAFPIVFIAANPMIVPPKMVNTPDIAPKVTPNEARIADRITSIVAHFTNLFNV
jgi:hypothetical protein